jgi:predicted translin family RNA/ssDNA-binding protein
METPIEQNPETKKAEAEAHIKSAHQILKTLQEKIGEHPEIGAAITRLEMALNVLAVQTGGLL